jgi:hypothetical protein
MVNEVPLIPTLEKIQGVFLDVAPLVKRLDHEHVILEKRMLDLEERQSHYITDTGLGFEVKEFKNELFGELRR